MSSDPDLVTPPSNAQGMSNPTIQLGQHPAGHAPTELIHSQEPELVTAWLIFTSEGPRFGDMVRLQGKSFLIGRASDCDLMLHDTACSRQHAKIRIEGNGDATQFMIHDLATDNGTRVNGNSTLPVLLQNGDVIQIGRTDLTFKRLA